MCAHPSCSYYYLLSPSILFLHILFVLHFLFYCTFYSLFLFFYHIYALVLCYFYIIFIFILLHCPLSGPDLIYISLLIIPCIIYYVTNKETLNLDPHSSQIWFIHLHIQVWHLCIRLELVLGIIDMRLACSTKPVSVFTQERSRLSKLCFRGSSRWVGFERVSSPW